MQNAAKGGDVEAVAAIDEVTRDMKLEFCAKVKKLSNKGLTSLVQKIKEVKAQSISDLPDDKIQIRVDDFEFSEFT
jgi:hypothetical protein